MEEEDLVTSGFGQDLQQVGKCVDFFIWKNKDAGTTEKAVT
jgi:hypothetical protein